MEQWKVIEGFETYSVSNTGKVKNNRTNYVVKSWVNRGYEFVRLHSKLLGGCKGVRVHRLVANAFIPNPDNLPMVNHKDEDKTNNHVDNLEWCSNKYNLNYGTRNQRISDKLKVIMIGNNRRGYGVIIDGVEYQSIKDASINTGVSRNALYKKQPEYKGHKIQYL